MIKFFKSFQDYIMEKSLSRIFRHSTDESRPLAIISAFRSENDKKTNIQNHKKLTKDVQKAGYGFNVLEGSYIENEGTPDEQKVTELSLFITGQDKDNGNLKGFIKKKLKEFKQESAVYKPIGTKEAFLLFQDGSTEKIGMFRANKMSEFMSKIRGTNSTFVFESVMSMRNSIDVKRAKDKGKSNPFYEVVWERNKRN